MYCHVFTKKKLHITLKFRLVAGATEKLCLVTDFPLSIQFSFFVLAIPFGYTHHWWNSRSHPKPLRCTQLVNRNNQPHIYICLFYHYLMPLPQKWQHTVQEHSVNLCSGNRHSKVPQHTNPQVSIPRRGKRVFCTSYSIPHDSLCLFVVETNSVFAQLTHVTRHKPKITLPFTLLHILHMVKCSQH